MNLEEVRRVCLALPHATEIVQWGADLVFKVGGKMFAVTPTEVAPVQLSFKCTPENFAELCERTGVIPAPYLARAQWVALETMSAISDGELRELLAESHRLVWERLPKRVREELEGAAGPKPARQREAKAKNTPSRSTQTKSRKTAPKKRK